MMRIALVFVFVAVTPVPFCAGTLSCRCAVLYSGHVRSFAQPRVHLSHKRHLVEQLQIGCDVDVFMYLSGETGFIKECTSASSSVSAPVHYHSWTLNRQAPIESTTVFHVHGIIPGDAVRPDPSMVDETP